MGGRPSSPTAIPYSAITVRRWGNRDVLAARQINESTTKFCADDLVWGRSRKLLTGCRRSFPAAPRGHRARGFTFSLRLLGFQRSVKEASCRRHCRRCAGTPLVDRHDAVTGRFVFVLPEPCLLPPNTPETGDYSFMRCCCRLSTQITGSYRFSPPHLHA